MDPSRQTRGLTQLLDQLNGGKPSAFSELVEMVYEDLRRIAGRKMKDRFGQPLAALTLGPTAIANDAIMQLRRQHQQFQNSDQFFAIATRLIDYAISDYQKHRKALKRGGGKRGASLEQIDIADESAARDAASEHVHSILRKLHDEYPRKAEVVTLHIICGHPMAKVAQMIGVSLTTAERDWQFARKWLARELTTP